MPGITAADPEGVRGTTYPLPLHRTGGPGVTHPLLRGFGGHTPRRCPVGSPSTNMHETPNRGVIVRKNLTRPPASGMRKMFRYGKLFSKR